MRQSGAPCRRDPGLRGRSGAARSPTAEVKEPETHLKQNTVSQGSQVTRGSASGASPVSVAHFRSLVSHTCVAFLYEIHKVSQRRG